MDRVKDDFFDSKEGITDFNKGYLQGQLAAYNEVIGIGYIVKNFKSNKV